MESIMTQEDPREEAGHQKKKLVPILKVQDIIP
jgi:hypothetical protein